MGEKRRAKIETNKVNNLIKLASFYWSESDEGSYSDRVDLHRLQKLIPNTGNFVKSGLIKEIPIDQLWVNYYGENVEPDYRPDWYQAANHLTLKTFIEWLEYGQTHDPNFIYELIYNDERIGENKDFDVSLNQREDVHRKMLKRNHRTEITWPGHNYMGPGNPLEGRSVRNENDLAAKNHDYHYNQSKSYDDIKKADDIAIDRMDGVGKFGLQAKQLAEQKMGPIYPGSFRPDNTVNESVLYNDGSYHFLEWIVEYAKALELLEQDYINDVQNVNMMIFYELHSADKIREELGIKPPEELYDGELSEPEIEGLSYQEFDESELAEAFGGKSEEEKQREREIEEDKQWQDELYRFENEELYIPDVDRTGVC